MSDELMGTRASQGDDVKVNVSAKDLSPEDRKMLHSIYWRSFTVYCLWAGEAEAGSDGFIYSLMPAFRRFYKDQKDRTDAMVRHTTWFNMTENVSTFVMGLVAAMEKENSESDDFDVSSIQAVKASLMGPLSGIGDAVFWGVLRVIAAAVGISVAATGSPLGPILFLLIYNIPSMLCRWWMTVLGYKLGTSFLSKAYSTGIMSVIMKAASILGLVMIGAMSAKFIGFNCALTIPVPNADPVGVQTYLDAIFKGLVPISLTLFCTWLLQKKVNVVWLILGIMALGLIFGMTGIVAVG
ncbi:MULTISPECIES: PTS system mannose/fructose/sorbose family transporter subunit IID [Atopobiaceae]|uniref:PTS system, mannose-specific IID component n=1 Tax=Parafannyhessea umbonata TaxID=604330 RepID=A0A1H6I9D4_9ACTN|nr:MULTISPECIES: PTS system mannose/fructose/sorbose family transporter subunit IID [Atopobiaceae]SEH43570.1 PTS system, mannose-specific IID component [Parafannyhessea umbonata]SJZ58309.1 PTS system, mannose-specific IID component [Olsenella sp. KH1P3]